MGAVAAPEPVPSSFFVSYAREDQAFVRKLHDALTERGREVWVDWEGAPTFVKWRPEVTTAIEAADVFVFVISEESAKSESCLMEVEVAAAAHKRFAPLVLVKVEPKDLPAEVADPTWLHFTDGYDFADGVGKLVKAADTDFDWLRLHTRLQVRAREWDAAGRDDSLLARGRDLEAALHWLAESALETERDVSPLQVGVPGGGAPAGGGRGRARAGAVRAHARPPARGAVRAGPRQRRGVRAHERAAGRRVGRAMAQRRGRPGAPARAGAALAPPGAAHRPSRERGRRSRATAASRSPRRATRSRSGTSRAGPASPGAAATPR